MKKINLLLILSISIILFTEGCGYTTSSVISSGAKSIYVTNFINKIKSTKEVTDKRMYVEYKSGMELDITRETVDRFILDGNLKVASLEGADLILEGELVDFKKEALRYDANDNILEYRVKVVVDIKLIDTKLDKIVWEENKFTGESIYRISGEYAKTEEAAIQDAKKDLATRIVERTVEGW